MTNATQPDGKCSSRDTAHATFAAAVPAAESSQGASDAAAAMPAHARFGGAGDVATHWRVASLISKPPS